MSRFAMTLGLVVLFAASAVAQPVEYGFKAGPTFPSASFNPPLGDNDYDRRLAAAFGGFLVLPLNEQLAAQIEALYIAKGGNVQSGDQEVKLRLDYFEVPVLARWTFNRSPARAWYVFGGPTFGIRTKARLEESVTTVGFIYGAATDVGDDFSRFAMGLDLGGGVDLREWFVIDGRYSWGLTDVNDHPDITSSLKTRAFTFMAGIRF
jgi:hypothetical protein